MSRQYNINHWDNGFFVAGMISDTFFLLIIIYCFVRRINIGPPISISKDKLTIVSHMVTALFVVAVVVSDVWIGVFYIKIYSVTLVTFGLVLMFLSNLLWFWTIYHFGRELKVVRTGPYKYVRHPMYSTLWIFAVGWMCVFGGWFVFATFVVKCVIVSVLTQKEEIFMISKFGADYIDYLQNTGAFTPFNLCGDCGVDYEQERMQLLSANKGMTKDTNTQKYGKIEDLETGGQDQTTTIGDTADSDSVDKETKE